MGPGVPMSRYRVARLFGAVFSVLLALGAAGPATAVTVSLGTPFARGELPAAHAALDGFLAKHRVRNHRVETFDGLRAWDGSRGTTNPQNTRVGSFTTLGGTGTGRAAVNGGTGLEVRGDNDMAWGRYDTDRRAQGALGGQWLDTNDTLGMRWEVGGLGAFNALTFFLTDVADVGARFSMRVGGQLFSGGDFPGAQGRLANGNLHFVRILLPEAVDGLVVELRHDRLNDGFGIDGAAVALIAPIPVPPAAALAATGLLALFGVKMRRRVTGRPAA